MHHETPEEQRRRIYNELNSHPDSSRELARISSIIPELHHDETESSRIKRATNYLIDKVIQDYNGDGRALLRDYDDPEHHLHFEYIAYELGRQKIKSMLSTDQ
jgi:hypothetical protein